jgi:outer membrane protein assembly factor BamB
VRKFFFSIKRVLSTFRRTTAIAAGIALTLVCWIAFDQPPGTKIWDFYTGKAIQSSAAIGHNGMVYFGTDGGKVYAFYPDGRGQWEFPTGDRIVASPAVGSDGTIYIGGYDGILYAIAPEGIERWRFRANGPISSSAAIGPDGTICFGTLNNRLFALRPDGSKIWDLAASEPVVGSPAIGANGILYAPSSDGVLAAIRLATGDVLWEFEAPNRILSSPAIAADGTLYFGCFDGHLYALDRYGKKKWTFATGGPIRGSASVGPDGTVYVGSDDRQLYALAPDGFKKWTFTAGKWIRATPAIAADGTVYIGSYDHSLYAVSPTGAKKWEYVTDHNVTASAAISRDGTVFFGSWNGRFYAIRGGAALAEGEWPRFRGDSQQRGSVGRITPPAPLIAETRTPEAEAEVPQTITITQEPGSVLGRWWSRLRSSSTKASTQTASAVAEARVIEANTSTTVVAAAEPALPTPNPGTMTPVWKQNDRESLAVDPSTVLDTAAAEPVRAITIRQEQGSVLGRWWRGLSKKKESPEPGSASAMATSSEPDATSVTTTLVTAAGTNDLDAEREAAYRARTTAMESRISTLESELATKRQNEAKVIADSDNLISGAETVVTTTTVTAPTSVRTRSVNLHRELVNESTTATQTARPGMLPMMRLISVDPPSKAELKKPETPRLQHPSEIPPESPAPKLENQMDLRSRLNVLPGEVDLNGEQEIAAAWGESPDEAPRQSSWWSRVFGSSEKAPKQEVAESPAPVAPTSIQSNGREAAYENRIISLEQHIAELNARLAQQQSDNATAPTTLTFAGPTKQVTSETGLSVNVAPVVSETVTAQPEIVTAREREYRAGLFQRMFSKNEAPVRSVAVEETTATINAGEVVESSAVRVISDSATLVSPETTTETTKVTRVVEAEPVQPEVVTAKEREYRAGLFQRMFSKNEAPVRSVAVQETTATINAGEVVESSAVRVISDSATLVSPETTTETTKVTRVVEAEPIQPEVVTAKEREYRAGLFQRMFSKNEAPVRSIAVQETTATINAGEVVESSAVRVISDSATLVSPETTTETTKVTRVVEAEPIQPEVVTAKEREYRAGLFQRMFSKNEAPVRSIAVEETTATINTGEVVESSAVRVISDSATLVSPETTAETTKVTRVVEAEPIQPEVVTAKEREYRAGLFQRMFSMNEAPVRSVAVEETTATINAGEVVESSAVRVISDSATLVSPETTTETTKVTRVVEAEPVQPEVVTAKERENRPGFFKRLFSGKDGDSAVRVVSVSRTSETSPEDSGAATVENLSSKDSYSETPATVEPKVTPPKPSGPFDAKLAKLEGLMGDMQEELEATRQERDELKRQIGGSLAESIVAVPAPTSKATTAERKLDPDSAAEADYGDKISKLESQLVSLSEELGNARVERARMREELATARRAPAVRPTVVDSVPVSPVLPETTTVIADSANLVTGDGAEIPQPEWLKREVRSVIATADPWTQPPGTAAATIAVAPTELAASESTVTESKISGAVDLVELPAAEETTRVEEKVIRRKPGFFGRLFGLGESVEERRYASTNVVVTPPAVNVSAVATSQPSDSQLLGNDTGFGSGAAQTNFPRVAYSPEAGTSFFTPGAGNLTQLPGFPRPQPALIAPPAREMDPTRISSGEGLKSVAVRESVPVVPVSEAGVTTVGSLSVDRPVVAIMSPPDGSELAGRVLDLRGLAQGERRIAQVLVSLDGGPFTPAAGLERWSFQSPVPTGQVLVRVKAMDATGRESEIVSRTYGHTANARLNVEVIGNGTVSPDLNARELQIGTPYEIVARPAPGNEFVGWSGGVTGSNPKLVFQMNSGLFLRAEFRPIGRELSLRGSYTGLLYPGELMQADRSGYFELNIERDGTFGGEIRLATSAAPLRGRFDTSGQATQTIERPGAAPITIRFMLQNEGAEVVGTFDADGVGIVMRGFRSVPDGDTLAAITPGRYTLVIPGPPDAADSGTPAGDGFGEVQIDAGGHVKFTGELPDGTVVKQETRISSGGVWPVYVPLYGGAGMLTGWISVTNHPSLDLHGDLRWIKPPTPSDRYYPGGFAARRFVFGSIYKPSHDNLDKRKGLAGVLLGGNLGRVVLGQDVATMPLTSPQRETLQQFKYQVDQNSGRVEGSFLHPETKQPTAFRGVLVQKRGWKSGYFMGADASGVVYLNGQ